MLRKFIYTIAAAFLMVFAKYLLGADFKPFLQWWAAIFYLGIIFLPLSFVLFSSLRDKGYLFSKTIGIAVTGYLMWLFSSLHILKFTDASCIISVAVGLCINILILFLLRKKHSDIGNSRMSRWNSFKAESLDLIITEELIFLAVFLLFTYIRGFKPEAYGTEKFMDYGFMTSMMRSDYMPPQDFWYSGTSLNYYYVGQFLAAFLTRLSFVKTSLGYNLMLMMTGAFAVMLPYALAYNLIYRFQKNHIGKSHALPHISGMLAGAGVCIAGNMHFPIYKWFLPAINKLFGSGESTYHYWFPDATRYIGYQPETGDKTIHEFPAYSFILGDLHAHVINILFVLTVLGILLSWMYKRMEKKEIHLTVTKEVLCPSILMLGFFVGLFHTTNFWDFPIYYVVSGAVILFTNLIVYNFKGKAYWLTALQGITILAAGKAVCLPFTVHFRQISIMPLLTVARTPLYQLLVLWGLPALTVIAFLICLITDDRRQKGRKRRRSVKHKQPSELVTFMQGLHGSDLFILTIGLCAIGLILIPEIIYIKDIYSGEFKRANTMFKLTYQAFIMFGICFGYIFIRIPAYGRALWQKLVALVSLVLFALSLCYVGNATKAWYGNIFDKKGYEGIDATAFMKKDFPTDDKATKWLNDNVTGTPIVLEANGDSYTEYQRVSVITGLPTVLGWYTHERLWKSGPGITDSMVTEILDERAEDILQIYTSEEEDLVRNLIQEYDISYIYVGWLELKKYGTVNHDLLKSLGGVVYEDQPSGGKVGTYIVKINK